MGRVSTRVRAVRFRNCALAVGVLWLALTAIIAQDEPSHSVPVELIVVGSLEQAAQVTARLNKGEDFAALAREYSTDPTSNDGGYLGKVNPETLRLEFRDALRDLKPGQVSGMVKIPAGFAFVKLLRQSEPQAADTDPARLLAVKGAMSVRLAIDVSGYAEFFQTIRKNMPKGPALRDWEADLKSVCEVRQEAPRAGIKSLQEYIAREGPHMEPLQLAYTRFTLAELSASIGNFDDSIEELEAAHRIAAPMATAEFLSHLEEVIGVTYLRRSLDEHGSAGRVNNSLLFPGHPQAAHPRLDDSAKAVEYLQKCSLQDPSNTELQWLLNLAYMTAGSYPSKVPKELLIPPAVFASAEDLGRFVDVAPAAGLANYGEAGGVIIDDFDNDGLLDVVTSQVEDCAPLRYFHNNGDGTFTDRAAAAGLAGQTGGLNLIQADYNNDGCVDFLVLRGGWEFPRRHSLLRNNCDGTFTDVTAQSGLLNGLRSSAQSAVWADIDNDGKLDLFIANENAPSQLFLNKGDGTFVDISREAGIDRTAFSKAVVSIDYDQDGYPDFFVSNFNGPDFLYHNNGDRTFTEVSRSAGIDSPWMSFGTWFFDYDNDGWPDLFVTGYYMSLEEVARSYMGLPRKGETLKLYKNLGNGKFRDVTVETGLDRVFMPMGANFGDIDNDGYPDIYLAVGNPSFACLMPNVLLHNQNGKRFVDITASSGTGALAKGHGVAFADLNNSGDEDIFVVMGGPIPGDSYTSRLFRNPGQHGNDWITVRLVGVKSNRSAIGARIAVTVDNEGNGRRTIWKTVGSGGSFGASPLQQHIGLGKSARIEKIEVWWPASKTKQTFSGVAANQFVEIKEFGKSVTKLVRPSFRLGEN